MPPMEVVWPAQRLARSCPANQPRSARPEMRGPERAGWILSIAFLAGVLVACGQEPEAPDPVPANGAPATDDRPSSNQAPVASETSSGHPRSQQPVRGPQVFRNTRAPRAPWFDALAERADPPAATWPKEVLALQVESGWRNSLAAGLPTEPIGLRWGPSVHAHVVCLPATWTVLLEQAGGSIREGSDFGKVQAMGVAAWRSSLQPMQALLEPSGSPNAEVQVLSVDETGQDTLRLRVWMRVANGEHSLEWESLQTWKPGAVPELVELRWLSCREVRAPHPWFRDFTRALIPASRWDAEDLGSGGVEMVERHDRLLPVSTMYLGMHGVAVGDVDGDQQEDVYLARAGGHANQLWIRQKDGRLLDRAQSAGVADLEDTGGVLICDLDGDGARDLVAGLDSRVVISWNDGQGRFPERLVLDPPGEPAQVYSLCAADADGDGDLDLYDTRYFQGGRLGSAPTPYHDANNGAPNVFWRNEGERRFRDATREVGLQSNNTRFSLAALWEDLDRDGDLDLYVTNDFGRNNLYRNDGGRFVDVAEASGALDMAASMGVSAADANRDGLLDLYVSNMHTPAGMRVVTDARFQAQAGSEVRAQYLHHTRGNTLLYGTESGGFEVAPARSGASTGGWAWGSVFLDYDNDGRADLLVPNGFATGAQEEDLASFFWREVVGASPKEFQESRAYLQAWQTITTLAIEDGFSWNGNERHFAYWNAGVDRFVDVSGVSGLDLLEDGRGAAVTDWNGDGRADVWLANRTAPIVRFLRNDCPLRGAWVGVELVGTAPNTEAVGALVRVRAGGRESVSRVTAGDAFLSAGSKRRLLGLGEAVETVHISVTWPDGTDQDFGEQPAQRWLRLHASGEVQEMSFVGFPEDPGETLEVPQLVPRTRVVPLDRLPLASWDLPSFQGPRRSVQSLGPQPVLVVVFGSWAGGGLQALAEWQGELPGGSLSTWVVSLDSPRVDQTVRQQMQSWGWLERSGRGGRRIRNLIDTYLGEVLGAAQDRPLPLGFLFDRRGHLAALYLGDLPKERIQQDAARLAQESLEAYDRGEDVLVRGRWLLGRPQRSLEGMAQFLRRAGEESLARELEAEHRRRLSRQER